MFKISKLKYNDVLLKHMYQKPEKGLFYVQNLASNYDIFRNYVKKSQ